MEVTMVEREILYNDYLSKYNKYAARSTTIWLSYIYNEVIWSEVRTSHFRHEYAVNRGRQLSNAGYGNKIDIKT